MLPGNPYRWRGTLPLFTTRRPDYDQKYILESLCQQGATGSKERAVGYWKQSLVLTLVGLGMLLAGCGTTSGPQVTEYALVEQSIDTPGSATFGARVPRAVAERQPARGAADLPRINAPLAAFGIQLAANPGAPFSAFALYSGDTLLQRDITRLWPVSLAQDSADFLLPFETAAGDRLMLTQAGVQPWPGASAQSGVAPVYYRDSIAYAQIDRGLSIFDHNGLLYSGAGGLTPRNLTTWQQGTHWALVHDSDVIVDGQSLAAQHGAEEVFAWQLLDEQPFFAFTRSGTARLHYAGRDLPYRYDQILHNQPAALAHLNPGGSAQAAWFYALRDGLWYYVEISAP